MNTQAHAHAHAIALAKSLDRKAADLAAQADYAAYCKGGVSKLSQDLAAQAAECQAKAGELRQALALELYLG